MQREIIKAYRKQSMVHHPDKNPDNVDEAQAKFIEIAEAFETLGDEKAREHYDRSGVAAGDATRGQQASASMHERLRQMFEEQMRRARENGEVTFTWGGGPDPFNRPKTCSRVVEGRSVSLRCPHEASKIRRVRFASYGDPGGPNIKLRHLFLTFLVRNYHLPRQARDKRKGTLRKRRRFRRGVLCRRLRRTGGLRAWQLPCGVIDAGGRSAVRW